MLDHLELIHFVPPFAFNLLASVCPSLAPGFSLDSGSIENHLNSPWGQFPISIPGEIFSLP